MIVEPDRLGKEIASFDPKMVLCSQPNTFAPEGRPTWVEFYPYAEKPKAEIIVDGRASEFRDVDLDDLLYIVDRAALPPRSD
jgi:hypothetical protein